MSETKKTDTAAQAAVPGQASAPDEREVLLKVENLTKHFPIKKGILRRQVGAVKAVDGIDFEVRKGETLGVVGESGCGKSTMGRVITRLQDPTGGTIAFEGQDITRLSTGDMRPLRRDIQMIFQDPYGSLNPRHTIGSIVSAPFRLQGVEPEGGVKKEVQRLLELVGLSPEHYNRYPHEFSGGQRQRIGIARALALKPKLVVADEPVSALDVSIQAQVVNLMDDLQQELGLTYVIIAHDLSVVRHVSDRIAVMYLGKIVELADRNALYEAPMHPYTKALMSAVPVPDTKRRGQKSERILLRGDVPSPIAPPSGCRFHTRCWKATEICRTTEPQLVELKPGQRVACHHPENFADQAPQDTVLLSAAKEASELVPDAVLAGGTPDGPEPGSATGTEPAAPDAAEVKSVAVKTTSPKPGSPAEAGDAPVAKAGTESEATAEAAPGPVPEVTKSESATGLSSAPDAKPEPAAKAEGAAESATVAKPETAAKAATDAGPEPVAEEAESKPVIGISLGPDATPEPAAEAETEGAAESVTVAKSETAAKAATDTDPEPVAEETNSVPGRGTSAEPGSKAEPAAEAAAEAEPGAAPDAPKAKGK